MYQDEFSYCTVWIDSAQCYLYATGVLFYEDINLIKENVNSKIN